MVQAVLTGFSEDALGSKQVERMAAAPALTISPLTGTELLQLGVRKCLLVASLLRDITKCPGDSDTGGGRGVGTCD